MWLDFGGGAAAQRTTRRLTPGQAFARKQIPTSRPPPRMRRRDGTPAIRRESAHRIELNASCGLDGAAATCRAATVDDASLSLIRLTARFASVMTFAVG